jgi:hypothetical protein
MDVLRVEISATNAEAIPEFRRLHIFAIAVNLVQLVLIVWTLVASSAR